MAITKLVSDSLGAGVAGKVLQVVTATKTDVFSVAGGTTFVDITGLSVSITPSSASSKILVLIDVAIGTAATSVYALRLLRNSTPIGGGTARGSRQSASKTGGSVDTNGQQTSAFNYLDSPSTTSATTYKVQLLGNDATCRINATQLDTNTNQSYGSTTSSTITAMEIAG